MLQRGAYIFPRENVLKDNCDSLPPSHGVILMKTLKMLLVNELHWPFLPLSPSLHQHLDTFKPFPRQFLWKMRQMLSTAAMIQVVIFTFFSLFLSSTSALWCYSCANCKEWQYSYKVECLEDGIQPYCVKVQFWDSGWGHNEITRSCAKTCSNFTDSTFEVKCCSSDLCNKSSPHSKSSTLTTKFLHFFLIILLILWWSFH